MKKTKDNSQRAGKDDYEVGYGKPPKNRQFGQPDGNKRHNGSWHKEDTPRYWLETMMNMSEEELEAIINGNEPYFKKKIAGCIKNGEWKEIKEMIQEVYGKMPEMQITMEADEDTKDEASKIIRGFCLP